MSSDLQIALLGLLSTLLAAALANEFRRRQQLEQQLFEKKREAYSSFNEIVNTLLGQARVGEGSQLAQQEDALAELLRALMETRQRLWTFGSSEVIRAYSDFQQVSFRQQGEDHAIVVLMADLILAMRKDMGLSNKGITALDVMRMFLRDADETYDTARSAADKFKQRLRTRQDLPPLPPDEPHQPQR